MWFRRSLDDFEEKKWDMKNGFFSPKIPTRRFDPWTLKSDPIYLVPVEFAYLFADKGKIANIERTEEPYIAELIESISTEGLREPALMKFDEFGKLRYHDGYHRLTAIRRIDGFTDIPVRIKQSPRIVGYGRSFAEEVYNVFSAINEYCWERRK